LTYVSSNDTLICDQELAHKGLERFFLTGSKAGFKLSMPHDYVSVGMLDDVGAPEDMNAPGWRLHPCTATSRALVSYGERELASDFRFDGEDAILVDYQDYH